MTTKKRGLQPSAAWRSMGDVIDELITVGNVDDAHMFLAHARDRMGDACDENLRYALGRYVPEAVGRTSAQQIAAVLSEAGLDSKPSSRPLG